MARAGAPLRAHPRAVPDRADQPPLRRRPDPGAARARARRRARPRRAAARAAASASGATPTSCAGVRRASVAALRQEVEAVDPAELARFLPAWQNVDAHRPAGAGPDRLREALVPLQGVALTPEVWERDVLPRRLGAYSPTWLDQLTTGGEIVWIGAGPLARTGRVALYFREDVRLAGPPPSNAKLDRPEGEVHDAIRERLAARPSFWLDLVAELELEREELHAALWDLVWAGEVDQRRLRAAARAPADARSQPRRAPGAALRLAPQRRPRQAIVGPLVADRGAVPRRPRRRARGCAPRPS